MDVHAAVAGSVFVRKQFSEMAYNQDHFPDARLQQSIELVFQDGFEIDLDQTFGDRHGDRAQSGAHARGEYYRFHLPLLPAANTCPRAGSAWSPCRAATRSALSSSVREAIRM